MIKHDWKWCLGDALCFLLMWFWLVPIIAWVIVLSPTVYAQLEELEYEQNRPRVTRVKFREDNNDRLLTVEHDDHLWVVFSKGGVAHHPACQKCWKVHWDELHGKNGPNKKEREFWKLDEEKE